MSYNTIALFHNDEFVISVGNYYHFKIYDDTILLGKVIKIETNKYDKDKCCVYFDNYHKGVSPLVITRVEITSSKCKNWGWQETDENKFSIDDNTVIVFEKEQLKLECINNNKEKSYQNLKYLDEIQTIFRTEYSKELPINRK